MQDYEIRFLTSDPGSPRVYLTSQASDYAAIRRAQRLAAEGNHHFEVWRGMACAYAGAGQALQSARHKQIQPEALAVTA